MTVEIGWERNRVMRAPGKKTTLLAELLTVNDDFLMHRERSSSSRDHRYKCTRITAGETFRDSCQENFKEGVLRQNVRASLRVKHSETAVKRTSKQECCGK